MNYKWVAGVLLAIMSWCAEASLVHYAVDTSGNVFDIGSSQAYYNRTTNSPGGGAWQINSATNSIITPNGATLSLAGKQISASQIISVTDTGDYGMFVTTSAGSYLVDPVGNIAFAGANQRFFSGYNTSTGKYDGQSRWVLDSSSNTVFQQTLNVFSPLQGGYNVNDFSDISYSLGNLAFGVTSTGTVVFSNVGQIVGFASGQRYYAGGYSSNGWAQYFVLSNLANNICVYNTGPLSCISLNTNLFDVSDITDVTYSVVSQKDTGLTGYIFLDVNLKGSIPEPASLALAGLALFGLVATRRSRQ